MGEKLEQVGNFSIVTVLELQLQVVHITDNWPTQFYVNPLIDTSCQQLANAH